MMRLMCHFFAGFSGLLIGLALPFLLWVVLYTGKEYAAYNMDPHGQPGAFEPILTKYLHFGEYIVGLATSSIVLLVGSSAFHSNGHLPWTFASPLILLALCVIWGILFIVQLILNNENVRHGNPHTKRRYALSETWGFSALCCFCLGYGWLAIAVTR